MCGLFSAYCANPASRYFGMSIPSWRLVQGLQRTTKRRRCAPALDMLDESLPICCLLFCHLIIDHASLSRRSTREEVKSCHTSISCMAAVV